MTINGGPNLGKLERLNLESIWPDEARNFTPWLALPENLQILGETLGIDLECEDQEVNVGPFFADILCKDTATASWVIIENQIKKTDHGHLGQILTYAAGLDARTLVWIAAKFTDQHRAALDWLNEHTTDEVSFFGVEIELWKIGNSLAAPKFNIVSKPNDWSRSVKTGTVNDGPISDLRKFQFEFWTAFKAYVDAHTSLRIQKPAYQHWISMSVGRAGIVVNGVVSTWSAQSESNEPEIRVSLSLESARSKAQFTKLEEMKSVLQDKIDLPLRWYNPENVRAARIIV